MGTIGAISRIQFERGWTRERMVEESVTDWTDKPAWLVSVVRGTARQDGDGIDFVAHTSDMGPLYVQVKSSKFGKASFQKKRGGRAKSIAIIVIKDGDDATRIRDKLVSALSNLRVRFRG